MYLTRTLSFIEFIEVLSFFATITRRAQQSQSIPKTQEIQADSKNHSHWDHISWSISTTHFPSFISVLKFIEYVLLTAVSTVLDANILALTFWNDHSMSQPRVKVSSKPSTIFIFLFTLRKFCNTRSQIKILQPLLQIVSCFWLFPLRHFFDLLCTFSAFRHGWSYP